jgi:hypothetical protein
LRVMEASARILPVKLVRVPSVAELPTCQKILLLHGCAPLINTTLASLAVVRVLPIWKMKTLLGFPWPSRMSCPVNCAEVAKQYTPGVRVLPPRSWPVNVTSHGCPAASL